MSLLATLSMVSALLSPYWLIGDKQMTITNPSDNATYSYTPSVGVYAKCGKPLRQSNGRNSGCVTLAVRGLATDSVIFPSIWKATTVFISIGIVMRIH